MIPMINGSKNILFRGLQSISGAKYTVEHSIKDVGIDHGGTDILVTQQRLDRAYVLAPFQ